ncbi:MAG TPA: DUF6438 domain-containing protein [Bacteroidia bacterium]|nr:DUF6438 domain-containing protein [Bacteroidia bacterium]
MKYPIALKPKAILVFLCCLLSLFSFANKIDELKNDSDVNMFLQSIDSTYQLSSAELFIGDAHYKVAMDSMGVKLWQKADLDNNGTTDLLVHVWSSYSDELLLAILDIGGKFSVRYLSTQGDPKDYIPVIKNVNNKTLLILYTDTRRDSATYDADDVFKLLELHKVAAEDTLIFNFNAFIDYNVNPAKNRIKSITYTTEACFGTCPVFTLNIKEDRKAIYTATEYNVHEYIDQEGKKRYKADTGQYNSTVDIEHFNKLVNLLNYLDFTKLKDTYKVDWTDDAGCTLTITYDDNKVKKIYDYGEIGTFGLKEVYNVLFSIRDTQRWVHNK